MGRMLRCALEGSQDNEAARSPAAATAGSREVPTSDETALDRGHILAIVRFHEPAELDPILEALMAGGIEMLEVTMDTPGALDAVRRASEAGTFIGAGTVLTSDEVRGAADAGARFVVSPAVYPEVITTALALDLTPVPGACSPTEVQLARSLGAGTIKLFPASTGGPAISGYSPGPFGGVRFVPTGGIGIARHRCLPRGRGRLRRHGHDVDRGGAATVRR